MIHIQLALSPARKGLASWLSFVMFNCVIVTFPFGILGQVWCLILSIPDLCHLSYFVATKKNMFNMSDFGCKVIGQHWPW